MLYCVVLCCTVLYCVVLCCIVLYCNVCTTICYSNCMRYITSTTVCRNNNTDYNCTWKKITSLIVTDQQEDDNEEDDEEAATVATGEEKDCILIYSYSSCSCLSKKNQKPNQWYQINVRGNRGWCPPNETEVQVLLLLLLLLLHNRCYSYSYSHERKSIKRTETHQ